MKRQRSEVAALKVAAQVEAHVRIRIGTEIVVVVVNRIALHPRARLSLDATQRLIELRGMLRRLDATRPGLRESRRCDDGRERCRRK
jgi:hypothetical protein